MSFQIKGTIVKIGDTESKSANFQVRELVLRVEDGKYPQFIALQLSNDRCDLADNFGEGQEVTVHFDLRGREHNGRYYNSLNCWKIVSEQGQNVPHLAGNEVSGGIIDEFIEPSQDLPF